MTTTRTEYACAEPGSEDDVYADDAFWTADRAEAERDIRISKRFGIDCYLIVRTVTISDWRAA